MAAPTSAPGPFDGSHALRNEVEHNAMARALHALVDGTSKTKGGSTLGRIQPSSDAAHTLSPAVTSTKKHKAWWSRFFPSDERLDKLFAEMHMGNYVAFRSIGGQPAPAPVFESMPIYVRVGMHLLFLHSKKTSLLEFESVDDLLKDVSIRQGKVYDDSSDPAAVLEHIHDFITTYSIDTSQLIEQNLSAYSNFNSFFYRKLQPSARPIADPTNSQLVSSAADCRLTVFDNVEEATKIWIKGKDFSLAHLLGDVNLADRAFPPGSSLAIFRLAPADYHRYHHPVGDAVCGPTKHLGGSYYTVNPQAVNENFDVFTANRRDVLLLDWAITPSKRSTVALVAVGAMMVGSIMWTKANQGDSVKRGEEAGAFAYGGSTVICVFPPDANIEWDADLLANSKAKLETMVRVGERIGISKS